MNVELRAASLADLSALREERRRSVALSIVPGFHSRLVEEARPFLILDGPGDGRSNAAEWQESTGHSRDGTVGYVLLLERAHGSHSHVTLIEMYLAEGQGHRYEDALDLVREEEVVKTLVALFAFFQQERLPQETFGDFCHRQGNEALLAGSQRLMA